MLLPFFVGPGSPLQPTEVQVINVSATTATVLWVVNQFAYTPEQYTVNYGTTMESLAITSTTVNSITDFSATNITSNVTLFGLTPNTLYYYQVRSTNSYGDSMTNIFTFTTLETGILTDNLVVFL